MITSIDKFSVAQARKIRNLTQNQVAESLNIHVQTYRTIEENPEKCTIEQAIRFTELTNLKLDEINFTSDSTLSRNL